MGEHKDQPSDLPQLPFFDIADWMSKHSVRSYYETPSDGQIMTKTGIAIGVEVVGHVVEALEPVAWIHLGWEILEAWAEASERPEKAKEAQLEAWNAHMWEKFWTNETAYPSKDAREAAFDRLVGDNAGHATVPKLTEAAELKRQELISQINERWLGNMQGMLEAKKDLEFWGPRAEARHEELLARAAEEHKKADSLADPVQAELNRRWAGWDEEAVAHQKTGDEDYYVNAARETMDSYKADLKTVMEFEANPANWELTLDQKALLHNLTSEMPATTSEMPAAQTATTDAGHVAGPVSDDADKIYDVIGGRPD